MTEIKKKPTLKPKQCHCGGKLYAVHAGWCCDKCDRKIQPLTGTERLIVKFINTGDCKECDNKGKWKCDKCQGDGEIECLSCGHLEDCDECNGTGSVTCDICHGESAKHD